jgi:hypothetical protein
MAAQRKLKQIRPSAHWRARRLRVQRELENATRLRERVSHPARKDITSYLDLLRRTISWLEKMEHSSLD